MAIDLNKIAEKLKRQKALTVTKNGQLVESHPVIDGNSFNDRGNQEYAVYSTLEPKRFALS